MSLSYAYEKFLVAIDALATGRGRIQERLQDALVYLLIRDLSKDLPESMRERFVEIETEATSVNPTGDEGSIAASIRTLSEERCAAIARELFEMFHELGQLDPINRSLRNG
jgi:hypothetical protein